MDFIDNNSSQILCNREVVAEDAAEYPSFFSILGDYDPVFYILMYLLVDCFGPRLDLYGPI